MDEAHVQSQTKLFKMKSTIPLHIKGYNQYVQCQVI